MPSEDNAQWYHVVITTYGAWLPGDERGFRTRNHRRHVEGDYKNPPPTGQYTGLKRANEANLKQDVVTIPKDMRKTVGLAIKDKLERLGAIVIAVSVSGRHCHYLAKMPNDSVRAWLGAVKKHVWFELRDLGRKEKLWAKGAKIVRVKDRRHQLNVYKYIMRHADEGAWVWYWEMDQQAASDAQENEAESPPSADGGAQSPPTANGGAQSPRSADRGSDRRPPKNA